MKAPTKVITLEQLEQATPREIRRILKAHHGSQIEVARQVGVTHTMIRLVLTGRAKSAHVLDACRAKAREILVRTTPSTENSHG